MHPHSYYRLRLLNDFVRILATPIALLYVSLRASNIPLGWFTVPAYGTFIVLYAFASRGYHNWRNDREARRMGGRPIPKVKGKWPGNIDILLDVIRMSRKSYFAGVYQAYFEKYRSTTLNLNVLWRDVVSALICYAKGCLLRYR